LQLQSEQNIPKFSNIQQILFVRIFQFLFVHGNFEGLACRRFPAGGGASELAGAALWIDLLQIQTNKPLHNFRIFNQSSCKEFQRKLSLPRAQLYSQLKNDILHKVPTQVVATMPMISSLEPPPELIRSELKNKKYSDKIHTYPRIDIFPRLKNVYRCTNNVVKNKKIEEPPIKDIYTQLEKTYSNSSMHSNF
jgi:hypothetical protein